MNPSLITTQEAIDPIFIFIIGVSLVMLLGIAIAMIYFLIRYHHSRQPEPASDVDHNLGLEVVWTVVPTLIVLVMFYYGWAGFLALRNVPEGAFEVSATARMWSWTFEYPGGQTSDRLRVPVGRPVKVNLKAVDVLHAFYVPAFRVKRDMVPGMASNVWFTAPEPGSYDIFCAEYCGVGHADMITTVEAMPPAEFEHWLRQEEAPQTADLGRQLLARHGCLGCHSLDGSKMVGPSFKGLAGRETTVLKDGAEQTVASDRDYIERSILQPGAEVVKGFPPVMPAYEGRIPAEELQQMVDYLAGVLPEAKPKPDGGTLVQQNGCLGCHSTDGSVRVGPTFKGLFGQQRQVRTGGDLRTVTADRAYLEHSIREPVADVVEGFQPMMPPYGQLSAEQVEAMVDYLEQLGK